uniref:uncharacterized protein C2orf78-like n=1 Tax=Jaculus jaculus TaxID=51337 RepID=UPI001E1B2D83|nr:uncharacterized protein C2orf78-like [Jaculus jaculus]
MADSQGLDANLTLETSLGMLTESQTFCLPQTSQLAKSCTLESKPASECWDISESPVQSPSRFLALPPAPRAKQADNAILDAIQTEIAQPLGAYQTSKDEQEDPVLLPLQMPNTCDIRSPTESVSPGNTPGSQNAHLGENCQSFKDKWALEGGLESNRGSEDLRILGEDVWLAQPFSPVTDTDFPAPTKPQIPGSTEASEVQVSSTFMEGPPPLEREEKEKVSDLRDEAPKAKLQRQDPEGQAEGEEGEVLVGSATASGRAPDITAKHSLHRAQKATPSRPKKAQGPGHERPRRPRARKSKTCEEQKTAGGKAKAEEKPPIPRAKRRKGHPPELCQEFFKKPRSSLGMHMLESVQVFHALGKKMEPKTGLSSCRALGNTRCTTEPRPSPGLQSGLRIPCQETGTEQTQGKGQKPEGSVGTERRSPSQCELPPPGKVKLVPLPFLSMDKPQARLAPRRPHSLASQRAPAPDPARPPSNPAQPPAVKPSQAAPASTTFTAGPVSSSLPRPGFNHPTQHGVSQSVACRPAPYKTSSCTSLHKEPVSTAPTKVHSLPNANTQYLLEDFSRQPIPWRKVDFPGPVESTPITDEQRPEREAMKRRAQRERENAAQYTALGRVQYFVQRERDMEISEYYGYMI